MIPIVQADQTSFTEDAMRAEDRAAGGGVSLAQACILEEVLGAVFGSLTLWYLVSSLASLA
jgi:hypothetical protein